MKVAAFGSGTRIEYANRVDPGFLGVRFGSPETTVRQLRETVHALATHVEWLHIEQQEKTQGADSHIDVHAWRTRVAREGLSFTQVFSVTCEMSRTPDMAMRPSEPLTTRVPS